MSANSEDIHTQSAHLDDVIIIGAGTNSHGQAIISPQYDEQMSTESELRTSSERADDDPKQTVYVVTEVYLPVPPEEDIEMNCAGVRIIGVFMSVEQANLCAEQYAKKLEDLTKRERDVDVFDDFYSPCDERDGEVPDEDPFGGRWQGTAPVHEGYDGTRAFQVFWGNRSTTITVEASKLFTGAEEVITPTPLKGTTEVNWIWRSTAEELRKDPSLVHRRKDL